jgi:hypothetical protein
MGFHYLLLLHQQALWWHKSSNKCFDNSVPHRPSGSSFTKKNKDGLYYHLCLDRAYSSKSIENEIIERGYVPYLPYKRKKGQKKKEIAYQHKHQNMKNKRWVIERTNSWWHNRFRKSIQDMKRR